MYIGIIILGLFIIAIATGFLKGILARWKIDERVALLASLLILGGFLIPDITIGEIIIFNIGGFAIPFIICMVLLFRSASAAEILRTLIATIVIGSVAANVLYFLPIDGDVALLDHSLFLGILGGGIAFLIGRSRRGAFISAALGTMLVSLFEYNIYWTQGYDYVLIFGSHSMFSATIIAAVIGAIVAEVAGETVEYSKKGKTDVQHFGIDDAVNNN